MRQPDFSQLLKVLQRKKPERPVLFEIGIAGEVLKRFADPDLEENWSGGPGNTWLASAWRNLGYDYQMIRGSGFRFPSGERQKAASVSMNEGALITDRESFRAYQWPDPDAFDYSGLARARPPDGMKYIVWGPGGVLENVVSLVGYERLCYMSVDEPRLAGEIFEAVGARLARYYELCAPYESVGALMCNDDWGFKTQTMLPPKQMREMVIPWHRRAVEAIHAAGKPALLHSCGNLAEVMEDVIESCGYDAKHSFEDAIMPVEQVYERWGDRIAILGGLDVDFLCRAAPERIKERARRMLERTLERGGYALGSGNSIPGYMPVENYLAMNSVALEEVPTEGRATPGSA